MALRLEDRRRLLLAQMAVERTEMALVLSEFREAATPSRLLRDIAASLWSVLATRRAAAAGPGAVVLLNIFKNHPLLASTLVALLPSAGGFVKRHLSARRLFAVALVAAAGWAAWRARRQA